MTSQSDKALTVVILLSGPVVAYIIWLAIGTYFTEGLVPYVFVSAVMILMFALWAWKGRPPWPYAP
ncbi:MAG: hypothetical protein ACFFD9_04390 [Candidatus Thorarchaeota archaeon]